MNDKTPWGAWEIEVLEDEFPDNGANGVRKVLRQCGRVRTISSIRSKAKACDITRRGRWQAKYEAAYCLPEQTLTQQRECLQLRRWKYPVQPRQVWGLVA
jgi:hypothetical protein